MPLDLETRRSWTQIRFEYYIAARTLWFKDCYSMGALNFGYAAEVSLKHLLAEFGHNRSADMNSHNVAHLVDVCRGFSLLPNLKASDDLLHYLTDRLDHRYPRQRRKRGEVVQLRGHALAQTAGDVIALDDILLQLDEEIVSRTGQTATSIMLLAVAALDRQAGRAFFHSNGPALSRLGTAQRYLDDHDRTVRELNEKYNPHLVEINIARNQRLRQLLSEAPTWAWNNESFGMTTQTEDPTPAANFRYPGRVIKNSAGEIIGVKAGFDHWDHVVDALEKRALAGLGEAGTGERPRRKRRGTPRVNK